MHTQHVRHLGVGCLEATERDVAGIRHEQVEPAVHLDRVVDQRLHLRLVGDIAADGGAAHRRRHLSSPVGIPVSDHDRLSPLGVEPLGQRLPDAARSAGDHCNLAIEFHGAILGRPAAVGPVRTPP